METEDWIKELKRFIFNSEQRIAVYKILLEQLHKNKKSQTEEEFNFLREIYRDSKNIEEKFLKDNIEENITTQLGYNTQLRWEQIFKHEE